MAKKNDFERTSRADEQNICSPIIDYDDTEQINKIFHLNHVLMESTPVANGSVLYCPYFIVGDITPNPSASHNP